MEKKPNLYSAEDKFKRLIQARFNLWVSLIYDADLKEEIKTEIKNRLLEFKDGAFKNWDNLEDAVYGTISSILTITESDNNKNEAKTLFTNIKDDIWALFKEIKN